MFKVHLDPGHYGSNYNKNTTGLNYYESKMAWNLTNYLKEELEKRGITVTLSRKSINNNPKLYDRGFGAKGCNLFLSLHSNACGTESVDYPIVYHGYDKTVAKDFAQKMANLIKDTMNTKQNGKTGTRTGSNGEYYGVLRGARAAGLTYYYIIEHSFHTNHNATLWLMNDSNLRELARKEADLIASYFIGKTQEEKKETITTTTTIKEIYRIRKSWEDVNSQIGAYSNLNNAKKACKEGYIVFNSKGEPVFDNIQEDEVEGYLVKVTANALNVRKSNSTLSKVVTTIKKNEIFTIVETKGNWGRLKSGAGWISLKYTKKI